MRRTWTKEESATGRAASALWASALAGILGTALGGALGTLFQPGGTNYLSFLLAGSGGIMISVSLMELVPEAIHIGGRTFAAAGLVSGALVLFVLDILLPHVHSAQEDRCEGDQTRPAVVRKPRTAGRLRKMGVLIGLGIALHNVPEGIAIGAACAHETSLGLSVAMLIALHNVPEGMAMAVPLAAGGLNRVSLIASTAAAGLPMAAGGIMGVLLGGLSSGFLSFALAFAAGAMMYVVGDELLPEAHRYDTGHVPTLGLVTGLFIGVLASVMTP